MVENKSQKRGFTLAEILIALIILMLFFVAAAKILTAKPKRHYANSVHGLYECYNEGGVVKSHDVYEAYDKGVSTESGDSCEFTPLKSVASYSIIIVYPSTATYPSQAYIDVQPSANGTLTLYPKSSTISGEQASETYKDETPTLDSDELKTYLDTTFQKSKVKDIAGTTLDGAIIIAW